MTGGRWLGHRDKIDHEETSKTMSILKDELHRLVEALPEKKNASAKRLLEVLLVSKDSADEVWIEFLAKAPMDDEPLHDDDLAAIAEAENDIIMGRVKTLGQVKKELGL